MWWGTESGYASPAIYLWQRRELPLMAWSGAELRPNTILLFILTVMIRMIIACYKVSYSRVRYKI